MKFRHTPLTFLLSGALLLAAGCKPEPMASFTAMPMEPLVDEEITFSNTSENADTYSWAFGDGASSAEMNPTHTFGDPGSFTVVLTATGEGGTDEATLSINVGARDPVAAFTASKTEVVVGERIGFTNESRYADDFTWDFGDGTTSKALNPAISYLQEGEYTVTLAVTGPGGSDDTATLISVGPPPVNIIPGTQVGNFSLGNNLEQHLTHISEESFAYGNAPLEGGFFLHLMEFDTTGIGFVLYTNSEQLFLEDEPFGIYGFQPFVGQTAEGISFGSRLIDVEDAYGTPDEVEEDGSYSYIPTLGISFWADQTETFVGAIYIATNDTLLKRAPVMDLHSKPFEPGVQGIPLIRE